MDKIKIGKIVNVVGLKGEIKVAGYSNRTEYFGGYDQVIIDGDRYPVERVRFHKGMAIFKLKGVDTREAAEALRNRELSVTEKDLQPLPQGEYYIRDLIGLKVIDRDGKEVGIVADVYSTGAQDIFIIRTEDGEFMLPSVEEFVKDINFRTGAITISLIEGMK